MRIRKNFFLTLILIIFSWLSTALIIYFSDPQYLINVTLFFIVFMLAGFLTFATLFENTRRGLLVSMVFTLFLVLRYLQIGNVLNFALLTGIAVSLEIYFSKR